VKEFQLLYRGLQKWEPVPAMWIE